MPRSKGYLCACLDYKPNQRGFRICHCPCLPLAPSCDGPLDNPLRDRDPDAGIGRSGLVTSVSGVEPPPESYPLPVAVFRFRGAANEATAAVAELDPPLSQPPPRDAANPQPGVCLTTATASSSLSVVVLSGSGNALLPEFRTRVIQIAVLARIISALFGQRHSCARTFDLFSSHSARTKTIY